MSVILITGAATGIGYLTAKKLATDGHTVWASMRDVEGRNARTAAERAASENLDLHTVSLGVTSQASAEEAVRTIVDTSGRLDVVVQNAGHLDLWYVEAFTDDVTRHLLDVNTFGAHRVNRAALPYLRAQRSGTLLYLGRTIVVTIPPFLGPYVASKVHSTLSPSSPSYEAAQFLIETSIVMPGAITRGTSHFPNAQPSIGREGHRRVRSARPARRSE